MDLPFSRPLAAEPLRRFLVAHAIPGMETYNAETGEHARLVRGASGPALVRFTVPTGSATSAVRVRLTLARRGDLDGIVARVRQWLDLDADTAAVESVLGRDPLLWKCVRDQPGLRVPGTVDSAELAMLAVLGQQVSLAAARTFAARLVAAQDQAAVRCGATASASTVIGRAPGQGLRLFPSPAAVFEMGPDRLKTVIGLTAARARTLHSLAGALANGLTLRRPTDPHPVDGACREAHADTARALLSLPGIGPWTASYIALRALGDGDAFPAGDLVLRRAMGVRTSAEAEAASLRWRPWRAYGVLHLWTREVFS